MGANIRAACEHFFAQAIVIPFRTCSVLSENADHESKTFSHQMTLRSAVGSTLISPFSK